MPDAHGPNGSNPLPPQSVAAEQSVLGALMLAPERLPETREILSEDDFYRRDHRLIYRAICDAGDNGQKFDPVTLMQWFEDHGLTEQIGRPDYISELSSTTPSAANIRAYVEIVRDKSLRRRLIEAGTAIVNDGFNNADETPADTCTRALGALSAIITQASTSVPPPADIFGEIAPPRLRHEMLPPPIANLVFEASRVKSCYPEITFLGCLTACAAATHDGFQVVPRPNEPRFRESARLWCMVIAAPGAKKTPGFDLAMSALKDMNTELTHKHTAELAEYERQAAVWRLMEKKRAKAEANDDGLIEKKDSPVKPKNKRIVCNDVTVEKLALILADNERGVLVFKNELTSWFGMFGKYSKGSSDDRAKWLEFYDGGSGVVDRVGGTIHMANKSVSLVGGIQPEALSAAVSSDADDGLLQRFIVAILPKELLPDCEDPEPTALMEAYDAMVMQLWNTRVEGRAIIHMSPEAVAVRRELDQWRTRLITSDGLPSMLRSAAAKYEGLFARLCAVYHSIGCAANRSYPAAIPVSGKTAERVALLLKEWIFPHHYALYTGLLGNASPSYALAKSVGEYLLTAKGRITRRNIAHGCNAWRTAEDRVQSGALQVLEQAGWLLPTQDARKGAGAWTINPRVPVDFAERAVAAARKRAAMAGVLAELRGE